MAGIGFALRRSVARDTCLGVGGAYLSAAVISCGPWLLSIATLVAISLFTSTLGPRERDILIATIMYSFALSLIGVGPIQMPVTRFLADMVYVGKPGAIGPSFVGTTGSVLMLLSVPIGAVCFFLSDLTVPFRLAMTSLFVGAVGTWIALVHLSAVRDYSRITRAFLFGYSVGGVCALVAGPVYGAIGYLMGLALGQLLIFGVLSALVLSEFEIPSTNAWNIDALGYAARYPSLVIVGLAYNLAIWSDKLLFWSAPTGSALAGHLRVSPSYDVAVFLSSIVAVPASVVFLVHVETAFYDRYRAFYEGIQAKRSLAYLRQTRHAMTEALRRGFLLLIKVQVVVVLTGLVLAEALYAALGLPRSEVVIFQNLVIANGVQVLLLVSLLILLYFDLRLAAAATSVTFLVANVLFTIPTLTMAPAVHGIGYGGAAIGALLVSQLLLWRHLAHLEFHTFTSQPISP